MDRYTQDRQALRYTCHAGLTEFIIPVIIDDQVIGHLQCGQVVARRPTKAAWQRIRRRLAWVPGKARALERTFMATPVIPSDTQKDLVALLQRFAHYAAVAHVRLLMLGQPPPDRAVTRALAFLDAHFRENVRLDPMAAAIGVSKRNLIRIVRARTGATVLDHLHRRRIDHACRQLLQSSASIAQAGLDCGFGSIQQFNRVFRKLKRDTPRRWREKASRSSAPVE